MSDVRGTQRKGGPRRGLAAYALWSAALIGVAAVVYVIAGPLIKPGADLKSLARGQMASLTITGKGAPPPATAILDDQGRAISLADLKAPVLVVNLWATWCAPCVKEMPTLAALQSAYGGRIRVAPISMDRAGDREKARAFIAEHPPLGFYQDPKYALAFALDPPVEGFPTTILYDSKGVERARLSGAAEWSGPDARAVIDALLAQR